MLEVLARIRHRRTRRQLSPYLDGMLSVQESRRLEAHLAQCQTCRDELAVLRATVQALAELPLAEAPRSFALTAAPRRIEAPRLGGARRLEFGLRLATVTAAFVFAVVAFGDLLGVPGGDEDEGESEAAARMQVAPMEAGTLTTPAEVEPSQVTAEDKAVTEAPTAAALVPALQGATPSRVETEGYGGGELPSVGTPSLPPVLAPNATAEVPLPGEAQAETPAATAAPAATATAAATGAPASAPALTETPVPVETPLPTEAPFFAFGLGGTPEATSPAAAQEAPAATATPAPAGANIAPSETEEQPLSEADEATAEAEREALAADEGGPSRETVVRWLEIGLATGLALLFFLWVLARRGSRA
ncbi:MAG TPA: zf-HC2 domain-containing protein [Dehalococcoidia bacterium]|nr:zf-HC2 domain-containing protein [Dehalococcoidia bacterium]